MGKSLKVALIQFGAPMLVTNRVGHSWVFDCKGRCVACGADGKEEILHCKVRVG